MVAVTVLLVVASSGAGLVVLQPVLRDVAALEGEMRGVRTALDVWGRQLRSFEERLARLERARESVPAERALARAAEGGFEAHEAGSLPSADYSGGVPREPVGSPGDVLVLADLTEEETAWLVRQELLGFGVGRKNTLLRGVADSIGALQLIDRETGQERVAGDAPTPEAQEMALRVVEADAAKRAAFDRLVDNAGPVLATREEARQYAIDHFGGRDGKQIVKGRGGFVIIEASELREDPDVRATTDELQRMADQLGVEYRINWMGKN